MSEKLREALPDFITDAVLDQWESSAREDEARGDPWHINPTTVLAILPVLRAALTEPAPDSLDAAWKEVVEALPEGWWVQLDGSKGGPFRALAGEPQWSPEYQRLEVFGHPIPTAALRALTEKLREER